MKKVICFVCRRDITTGIKVSSFFNYPDKYWDEKVQGWNKRLPEILNGVMCSECSQKDLELRHAITVGKDKPYLEARKEYERIITSKWVRLGKLLKVI